MKKKTLEKYKPYEVQISTPDMLSLSPPAIKVSLKVSLLLKSSNEWKEIKLPAVVCVSEDVIDNKEVLDVAIENGIEEIKNTLKQGWIRETIGEDDDGNEIHKKLYFKDHKIIKTDES